MTKMLLLPFYTDCYDRNVFGRQVREIADALTSFGLTVTAADPVDTYEKALALSETLNPLSYDLLGLLPVTWAEPRLAAVAARAFFGRPTVILAVNEFQLDGKRTEFSSAPAAAALYGCYREMGVPAYFLPGPIRSHEKKLKAIIRAASALSALRKARIGAVGHNFNGITAGGLNLSLLRRKFGTEVYSIDGSTVIRKAEALTEDDTLYRKVESLVKTTYSGLPEEYQGKVVRITAALFGLTEEYGLDALEVRCHTEFSQEFGLSMCLPLGLIGNEIAAACEADLPVLFTELLFKFLSGGKTPSYADLRTFTEEGMDAGACGFAPTALTGNRGDVAGENGYLTNSSGLNPGRLTLGRLESRPGGVLTLHAATGEAERIERRLTEYGCAPYPMAHIRIDGRMEEFLKNVGANHYAFVYEDLADELKVFAELARIGLV